MALRSTMPQHGVCIVAGRPSGLMPLMMWVQMGAGPGQEAACLLFVLSSVLLMGLFFMMLCIGIDGSLGLSPSRALGTS